MATLLRSMFLKNLILMEQFMENLEHMITMLISIHMILQRFRNIFLISHQTNIPFPQSQSTFKTAMCKLFMHTTDAETLCTTAGVDVAAVKATATGPDTEMYLTTNAKAIRITLNVVDVSEKTFFIVEPVKKLPSQNSSSPIIVD